MSPRAPTRDLSWCSVRKVLTSGPPGKHSTQLHSPQHWLLPHPALSIPPHPQVEEIWGHKAGLVKQSRNLTLAKGHTPQSPLRGSLLFFASFVLNWHTTVVHIAGFGVYTLCDDQVGNGISTTSRIYPSFALQAFKSLS